MWKQKYMLKNLLFFLVPLLVPILILGAFSILVTQHIVKDDMNQKNRNLLAQTRNHLELILNEMDTLSLNYQTNHVTSLRLKSILHADRLEYEQALELELLNNFLSSPANSRPYIHSIYVYYDNPARRMLTSTGGIASINSFYDVGWFQSYVQGNTGNSWIEERYVNRFGITETRIISIYRKLYTPGARRANGVLVLNILPAYIEAILADLSLSPEQTILILDDHRRILFQSNAPPDLSEADLDRIIASDANPLTIRAQSQTYAASHLPSNRHQLHYVSLIPQDVLYRVPELLRQATFILLFCCLLIGIFITYILTRRNYNNLKNIVSIISAAKQDKPLPRQMSRVADEYGFILQNIITTFIEQHYLETQLSKRNYELKYMELLALQAQINPHFLYNTLEVIYWQALGLSGKPNAASKMIEHLSDILKYALSSPKQTVMLNEEIRYTEIYLEIQKTRNKNKLAIVWEVEDAARHLPVIKLLLQPIVENSIYHGIKEKKRASAIKFKIRLRPSFIWIRVVDNGRGMTRARIGAVREELAGNPPVREEAVRAPSSDDAGHIGIGLYNTNKRLKLFYGQEAGLRIVSKADWGTMVELFIPLRSGGEAGRQGSP